MKLLLTSNVEWQLQAFRFRLSLNTPLLFHRCLMNCLVNPALHPIRDFQAFRYRYLRLVTCKPCTQLLFFVSVGTQVLRPLSLLHLQHQRLPLSLRLLLSLLPPVPFNQQQATVVKPSYSRTSSSIPSSSRLAPSAGTLAKNLFQVLCSQHVVGNPMADPALR